MKIKQCIIVILAVLVSLSLVDTARGVEQIVATERKPENFTRESLAGLSGVFVEVTGVLPPGQSGVTKAGLKTDIELQLRRADIRVVNRVEALSTPGSPHLILKVITHKDAAGYIFAFGVELTLVQDVVLSRDRKSSGRGTTWSTGAVGLVGAESLLRMLPSVWDRVDQFVKNYRTANPNR
ncbi:MAG: hypothetical protein ACE5JQ_11035 [Candidatus Methylomirabilales bacterium]